MRTPKRHNNEMWDRCISIISSDIPTRYCQALGIKGEQAEITKCSADESVIAEIPNITETL